MFLDLLALLRENAIGENPTDVMEGEVVRLGNILEFVNRGGGISRIGPQSFPSLTEFAD